NIPVIISSDFLEAYNVFAPGQGLPQISQATAMGIPVVINCYGNGREQSFRGNIVAFSDRINSVLVPKTFLDWANKAFGDVKQLGPSRLFIKTNDASNPELLRFVDKKAYNINKDKTRFGRTKQTLQGIFSGLGIFGLLVVVLALMLFSFYLQLVIARSRDSLQLLLMLGYSPRWLSNKVSKQFVPVYVLIVLAACIATQIIQWTFHHYAMYDRPEISSVLHWSIWLASFLLILIAVFTNYQLVKRLVYVLY
ncbi:MAG TPA: FtsX-like permease family protein, partial [Flavisolibacter sp.]|nr:FtsX-like permease family protein [Flavisolibacter sp.]